MSSLQDTAFWLLFLMNLAWTVHAFRSEWRKGAALTDEIARRAGVGP